MQGELIVVLKHAPLHGVGQGFPAFIVLVVDLPVFDVAVFVDYHVHILKFWDFPSAAFKLIKQMDNGIGNIGCRLKPAMGKQHIQPDIQPSIFVDFRESGNAAPARRNCAAVVPFSGTKLFG